MAEVSGTEVLYKRESKLGVTTMTFRKRRYMLPNVVVRDSSISASTGNLQNKGTCVMLDVGIFCPHCAGAISATLSGSHSKLVISKCEGHEAALEGPSKPQLEYPGLLHHEIPEVDAPQPLSCIQSSTGPQSKQAKIKKIKTEHKAMSADETSFQMTLGSCCENHSTAKRPTQIKEQTKRDATDKLSSSDYESLDRDSRLNSISSTDNSTDTCISVTEVSSNATVKVDDAYSSMNSSGQWSTLKQETERKKTHHGLSKMPPLSSKYSSLPRDVGLSRLGYSSSDEGLILDSMHVDVSDTNEEVLVDELLSDELIDEEYQNLVNGTLLLKGADNTVVRGTTEDVVYDLSDRDDCDTGEDGDDSCINTQESDRSASPESLVDDVLENMDTEVFSGDATLPRVFSLTKDGSKKLHSSRKKLKRQMAQQSSTDSAEVDLPPQSSVGDNGGTKRVSSAQRKALKERVKVKYKDIQSFTELKLSSQKKTDFSHEDFFEDVVEALTDLEEGFTTDWTSDYDSDVKALSTPDSNLGMSSSGDYKETLAVYDMGRRKTTTSSCECLADDRSRDLDSSYEHIPSTVETPSEASMGDYSMEGYGSSSECSSTGQSEPSKEAVGMMLLDQLINDTQNLTDELINLDEKEPFETYDEDILRQLIGQKESSPIRDQFDNTEEVFLESHCHEMEKPDTDNSKLPPDTPSRNPPIPVIIEPDISEYLEGVQTDQKNNNRSEDELSSVGDLDSSLENLLSCNVVHCSTSDLDEPYMAELKQAGIIDDIIENTINSQAGSTIKDDFEKCLHTKTTEVDEFVPETTGTESAQPEILKHAYQAAQYVAAFLGNHQIAQPQQSHIKQERVTTQKECSESPQSQDEAGERTTFESTVNSGEWKELVSEADTKVAAFETREDMSKEQAQQFIKYILNQSGHSQASSENRTDVDDCLDEVCHTCELKPGTEDEVVKSEEVTTQEVALVFTWPKKMCIGKELVPAVKPSQSGQPFRTIHLRRVMKVNDFDVEVLEGPTIETIEYGEDGTSKRCITQGPVKQMLKQKEDNQSVSDNNKSSKQSMEKSDSVIKTAAEPTYQSETVTTLEAAVVADRVSSNAQTIPSAELPHYMDLSHNIEVTQDILEGDESSLAQTEHSPKHSIEPSSNRFNTIDAIVNTTFNGSDDATDSSVFHEDTMLMTEDSIHSPYCAETTHTSSTPTEGSQRDSEEHDELHGSPRFIDQNERNIYVLNLGKYFPPRRQSSEERTSSSASSEEDTDRNNKLFLLQLNKDKNILTDSNT